MNTGVNIRLELGIDAQRFTQQVMLQNENIENQVSKGIELALNDLCEGDKFVEHVRNSTVIELERIISRSVNSWEIQKKIESLVAEKIGAKLDEYANTIAEKITSSLK